MCFLWCCELGHKDLYKECGNPLNEQGEKLTKDESTQPLEKKIGRIAEEEYLEPKKTNENV